jgi:hypothetical protein
MRMRLWLCVLVSVIAETTAAQSNPDFSGRWVLVNPAAASDIARDLVVRESFEAPVTVLTVERRSKGDVRIATYKIGLAWGRTSGITEDGQGPITRTRLSATWDGDRLVIETGTYWGATRESGPYSEHDEIWSLDAQGRLVMIVTDRGSGTELRTTQLTYRRP